MLDLQGNTLTVRCRTGTLTFTPRRANCKGESSAKFYRTHSLSCQIFIKQFRPRQVMLEQVLRHVQHFGGYSRLSALRTVINTLT